MIPTVLPHPIRFGLTEMKCPARFLFAVPVIAVVMLGAARDPLTQAEERPLGDRHSIDFAEQVQPILRRHCLRCHGETNQEADLRLDVRQGVLGSPNESGGPDESAEPSLSASGEPMVIAGRAADSLLFKRISDPESGDLMPLDGDPLSQREIDVIRRWIDQGAVWGTQEGSGQHWAYQPVTRPPVPESGDFASPIDRFVARRLAQHGLAFSDRLDRPRLLRRVSLALIGLPPTPEQVRAFVEDPSEDAYERAVDALLQSPRYGERWAVSWLDLARYADSNGFQADQIRDNWAYRDWVIRAFNDGMPFDQFVIDQIAGDLRDNATIDQKTATGFHRMTTCNVEAGVHPEANRVNQVVDRVNTTATVFLGTTLECAQCHDHKYDPFTQQDYYRLFAYFNNTPLEVKNTSGVTWDFYGPTMDLPMAASEQTLRERLQQELTSLQDQRRNLTTAGDRDFQQWLTGLQQSDEVVWQSVVPEAFESTADEAFEIQADGAVLLRGSVPDTVQHLFTINPGDQPVTAIRLDVLTDDAIPGKGPGRGDAVRSNIILNEFLCELVDEDRSQQLELVEAVADFSQSGWPVSAAIDGDGKSGWAIAPQFGKPHWASFTLASPLTLSLPNQRLRITLSQMYGRGRVIGKPRISLFRGDPQFLHVDPKWRRMASKQTLSEKDLQTLRGEFEKQQPALREIDREIARVNKELSAIKPETTLVMQEMDSPRETFVMIRGDYENLGDKVQPGTPAVLPKWTASSARGDRLDLARWLTSRDNPLLSRVTVNRWWTQLFGVGLVSTPEDFGTQGEPPSHPQLLDWLASELMDSGWSMKHVHKLMVMSHAFQQSSALTPELLERDPDNRLLARGPRFRMPAELIRDNALAVSGLLSEKMYGPPIMPYQPDNIWRSVGRNQPTWKAAENEDRFRRGVYVIWKRAAPYPSFINFDAPDRGSCTVQRGRSNTPLQALTLLNDPAYVEMALALADRIVSESPSSSDVQRIEFAMELAVSRGPSEQETAILKRLLDQERQSIQSDPSLIDARTKRPFDAMPLRSQDKRDLAVWIAIANTLLNLDETMSL